MDIVGIKYGLVGCYEVVLLDCDDLVNDVIDIVYFDFEVNLDFNKEYDIY